MMRYSPLHPPEPQGFAYVAGKGIQDSSAPVEPSRRLLSAAACLLAGLALVALVCFVVFTSPHHITGALGGFMEKDANLIKGASPNTNLTVDWKNMVVATLLSQPSIGTTTQAAAPTLWDLKNNGAWKGSIPESGVTCMDVDVTRNRVLFGKETGEIIVFDLQWGVRPVVKSVHSYAVKWCKADFDTMKWVSVDTYAYAYFGELKNESTPISIHLPSNASSFQVDFKRNRLISGHTWPGSNGLGQWWQLASSYSYDCYTVCSSLGIPAECDATALKKATSKKEFKRVIEATAWSYCQDVGPDSWYPTALVFAPYCYSSASVYYQSDENESSCGAAPSSSNEYRLCPCNPTAITRGILFWNLESASTDPVGHLDSNSTRHFIVDYPAMRALTADGPYMYLWDLRANNLLHAFVGHTGWITAVQGDFTRSIATSAGDDGFLMVWDMTTGSRLQTLSAGRHMGIRAMQVNFDRALAVVLTGSGQMASIPLNKDAFKMQCPSGYVRQTDATWEKKRCDDGRDLYSPQEFSEECCGLDFRFTCVTSWHFELHPRYDQVHAVPYGMTRKYSVETDVTVDIESETSKSTVAGTRTVIRDSITEHVPSERRLDLFGDITSGVRSVAEAAGAAGTDQMCSALTAWTGEALFPVCAVAGNEIVHFALNAAGLGEEAPTAEDPQEAPAEEAPAESEDEAEPAPSRVLEAPPPPMKDVVHAKEKWALLKNIATETRRTGKRTTKKIKCSTSFQNPSKGKAISYIPWEKRIALTYTSSVLGEPVSKTVRVTAGMRWARFKVKDGKAIPPHDAATMFLPRAKDKNKCIVMEHIRQMLSPQADDCDRST